MFWKGMADDLVTLHGRKHVTPRPVVYLTAKDVASYQLGKTSMSPDHKKKPLHGGLMPPQLPLPKNP
jgi:hypothetical protein